ncbi:D-alanyl-D-alanine carboxypeptidase family protein [Bacillus sp. DTU_2020_1000418_1_SI_GHA_SEK_038]|uniref:D-alanyl-D-alanine carboxypeptidase family protein n=1 Tax=Bacillus sp. DTU_2020_1000418_1_SI_GHA_SEK_038 TaxID=3077585 RepID=UPI0028E3D0AE|nr:D-alanyl-D-alanine carboxypeptidase family protein [Bacillus sp. DTU_2020_1000418_1_SI_GHA_SEK_038]WNS74088.1 D-alanyl-D-alanine carboxypeptidase family protein [Bacillus sp. DTU_2020_1000418_1_SI_GHA_SEK_038]
MKKFKNLLIFPLIAVLLAGLIPQKAKASVNVSARSAIVMEQGSGRILFEKDAFTPRRIASITKIMTAILAIESGKMDEMVKVSEKAVRAEGSSIYLIPGEKIKLEDLVYGLMLRSGNDAAVAIAEHIGGSLDGFVFLMNQKAEEIGMENTHFANPHGLDDHENHYSTAYDMALLTRYAMNNKEYGKISGTKVHKTPHPNESWDRKWTNKNRLLSDYEYCTGGKTGFTKRAKRTLVTTASKGELDLIAVTLNATGQSDWNDHIQMYEMGFKNYSLTEVLPKGIIKEIKDKVYKKKVFLEAGFNYPITRDEKDLFEIEYKMMKPDRKWEDGENIPDIVGKATVYFDNRPLKTLPIYFKQERTKEKGSFFGIFRNIFISIVGVKDND